MLHSNRFDWQDARGGQLFAQRWEPQGTLSGVIGIVHGLGEHSSRYQYVAERLSAAGFLVLAYDQLGHGRSPGARGHIRDYSWLLDDIGGLLTELKLNAGSHSIFLYGHSLGGNLVLNYMLRRSHSITGIVASSPLLLPTVTPPVWKRSAAQILSAVWPSFQFGTGIQATDLTDEPTAIAAHRADRLIHDRVSARLAIQMLAAGRWALDHAHQLAVPTLLLHGTEDPVTSCQASSTFAARAKAMCLFKSWPGLRHELHWEQERGEVVQSVVDWLQSHCRQTFV